MQILNCIIVDDEPLARQVILSHLSKIPFLSLKRECKNAIEAYDALNEGGVDVMFCDINMPEITGLDLIRSLNNRPQTILTTAYMNYALEGFELDVIDYLTKPITFERFLKAINKLKRGESTTAKQTQQTPTTEIYIKEDYKLIKIPVDTIAYVEGMKDYVKIYFLDKKFIVTHATMKRMEEILPETTFVRVQKSFIINKKTIKALVGNMLELDGQVRVPIGIQYKDNIDAIFNSSVVLK